MNAVRVVIIDHLLDDAETMLSDCPFSRCSTNRRRSLAQGCAGLPRRCAQ